MLDPIKATVITPGLDVVGQVRRSRAFPASIVTQVPRRARRHRREDRALFVLHHVHDRHHQGPLEHAGDRAAAVQGRLRQATSRCGACCRSSCWPHPRYERVGLRDLCEQIHGMYKANDVARVTTEMYLSDMEPAMKPSDAFARHGASRDRARRDRRARRPRDERAADALSAGHSAADSRRALQPARSSSTCSSRATSTSSSPASTPTSTASSKRRSRDASAISSTASPARRSSRRCRRCACAA